MSLLQLPLELLALVGSHLSIRDIARLLRVHSSLHNNILISELHKKEAKANGGLVLLHYARVGNERGVREILAAGAHVDIQTGKRETALLSALRQRHTWIVRLLLAKGACPDSVTSNRTSPLTLALDTRSGDNAMLRLLLHHGADPNRKSGKVFHTHLFRAVASGDPAKVGLLLDYGADASMHDSSLVNPLHTAAEVNAPTEIVRLLIGAGSGINDHDREGKTPLQVAALNWSVRVVKELLHQGADANISSRYSGSTRDDGKTALFYAFCSWKPRNSETIIRLLIRHGADINKKDNESLTAMHAALKSGSARLAQLLLDHGAQISPQLASSALYRAAENAEIEMVTWLLAQGADVNHRGLDRETPIYVAIRTCWRVAGTDTVRALLRAGANIDCKNTQGLTPMGLAAQLQQTEIVKMLIDQRANIQTKDIGGQTPLHSAVGTQYGYHRNASLEVTKILIEHGADPNAKDIAGYTPVHMAASARLTPVSQEILRVLIRAGGKIHTLSHDGRSPKVMAVCYNEADIVSKFFGEYGA